MKKIFALLATVVVMIGFQSCTDNDNDFDNDTISEVFELKNINFTNHPDDGYRIYQTFTPNIFASDVVLIYRLSGTIDSETPIWQLIPKTLYLNEGELDYDYDFSKEDFKIYARGTYNLATTPSYIQNQTFRIVIVPGSFSKSLNTANYNEVMSALKLDESKVKEVNF